MTDDERAKLTAEARAWQSAWHAQRLATGRAWWEGYRRGQTDQKAGVEYGKAGCVDDLAGKELFPEGDG